MLVVATVKTYQPWPDIQSYAVKMFENGGRGIGKRKEGKSDNGMLVLLAVDDRRVRIEVGYGLEPFITDGFAGQVSREAMVPFFKQGDYGGGLRAGAEQVAARLAEARGTTLPGVDDVHATSATRRRRISLVADPPSAVSDLHRAASGRRRRYWGGAAGAGGRAAPAGSVRGSGAASEDSAADRPAAGSAAGSAASAEAGAAAGAAARHGRHTCGTGRQSCPSAIRKED